MKENRATFIALVEKLCPSANGASAHRLTEAIELNHSIDFSSPCNLGSADCAWIAEGLEASAERADYWRTELELLEASGIRLVTIVDPEYPANLQLVHDAPPFLFVRGELRPHDNRAVAIVGTRAATSKGLATATRLARSLSKQRITIVSGLAAGIDTAAHKGALDAGGRTIAIFGTGIMRVYPAENRRLAEQVSASGACVSQFLPRQQQTRWSFPVRNVVTSGLAVGTVVVEASETSGAKLQAQNALAHGKRLFLVKSLVEEQTWARELLGRPGVLATDDVDEIAETVATDVFSYNDQSEPADLLAL